MMQTESDKLQDFYGEIAGEAMAPLWEVLGSMVTPAPKRGMAAHLWRWTTIRARLVEAGALIDAAQAERRVLVLENPAFAGQARATRSLFAGVQMVLPGEVARTHRHTQSALRFVLESAGGYTTVGGERTLMQPGDFVITPAWAFHDHGNETASPALWLDVLDAPMVSFFDASFSEHPGAERQAATQPAGVTDARFASGLLPMEGTGPWGATTTVLNYPYARTRAALEQLSRETPADPRWGHVLRYSNPLDGGWAMPTIASWIAKLTPGTVTIPSRSTDSLVVAVAEGTGSVEVEGTTLRFGPKDIFALPNWSWRRFTSDDGCVLFFCSDRVVLEKLGLWREETGNA
jgi:gentisate 1,2-dioxygenase